MSHVHRLLLRGVAALPLFAGFSVAAGVATVGPAVTGCASASATHHAALVIEHGDGRVLTYCISFDSAQITGEQMLAAAHVELGEVQYGSLGQAVCQLDSEPQQYPASCWTATSAYWATFVSHAGRAWRQSTLGVSSQMFGDGDAEGFRFVPQSSSATPPSPAGVCAAATVIPVTTGAAPERSATATVVGGTPASPSDASFHASAGVIAAIVAAALLVALLATRLVRERARSRVPRP